jgi:predicted ATPase
MLAEREWRSLCNVESFPLLFSRFNSPPSANPQDHHSIALFLLPVSMQIRNFAARRYPLARFIDNLHLTSRDSKVGQ